MQDTESKHRSCEDKLVATQERLESAERKLALVDDTISNTDALSVTVRNQGAAGGSKYQDKGGAANRLCLTMEPEFDETVPSSHHTYLQGAEYDNIAGHHDHDVPCSVCRAPQSTTIMVPATLTCPTGWVTQYTGHLVAGHYRHDASSEYQCLDREQERMPGVLALLLTSGSVTSTPTGTSEGTAKVTDSGVGETVREDGVSPVSAEETVSLRDELLEALREGLGQLREESITIMVPATLTCPPGWVTQYTGHLVAGFYGHEGASEYLCLDGEPEHTLGERDVPTGERDVRPGARNGSESDNQAENSSPFLSAEALRLKGLLRKELLDELMAKTFVANNVHRATLPYHFHHCQHHHHQLPSYSTEDSGTAEELSALKELLQATESRLRATEYRLRSSELSRQTTETRLETTELRLQETECKLQTMEERLQPEPNEPQATQEERLESAERKLSLTDQTASDARVSNGSHVYGSTFVRWGRTQCPNNTQLVYSGFVGGSWYEHTGAASNRLCLTTEPEFDDTVPSVWAYLHGAEYEHIPGHHNSDPPCCVCRAPQSTTIMVPATLTCPPGWVTQYSGHLVAGHHSHQAASEYLCLDGEPEDVEDSGADSRGVLFYYTIAQCRSLPCPTAY
nr:hypothetical protein BaRGS_006642 [Batillaria attramentaria]